MVCDFDWIVFGFDWIEIEFDWILFELDGSDNFSAVYLKETLKAKREYRQWANITSIFFDFDSMNLIICVMRVQSLMAFHAMYGRN